MWESSDGAQSNEKNRDDAGGSLLATGGHSSTLLIHDFQVLTFSAAPQIAITAHKIDKTSILCYSDFSFAIYLFSSKKDDRVVMFAVSRCGEVLGKRKPRSTYKLPRTYLVTRTLLYLSLFLGLPTPETSGIIGTPKTRKLQMSSVVL